MSRLADLIAELKRRGVLRVAAVYLVGAWLVIQVADVVFPRLGMPSWTVTFVIVAGALLFPVVVGVAWAFDFTRRGFERTAPLAPTSADDEAAVPMPALAHPRSSALHHRPHATVILAAMMTVPLVGFGLWYVNDARGFSLDATLVAVTPFRVAGAAPEAHYLREGLMDLIAARIGGAGGEMKVVSPRTVSRMLRDELGSIDADPDRVEALALARELGAGRLLEGEVVGGGDRIMVTASLYNVFTGDRIGDPATISAHPDSLHRLVDEIAARLVAASAGVTGDQLAHLTTSSLPALRAYLDGERAFRRGMHTEALRALDQAVTLDTTFALAALGLLRAQGWTPGQPAENSWPRAIEIARRGLDRLSEQDRLYFEAFIAGGAASSLRERLEIRLRAAERAPDIAELRYLAGDGLFHWGAAIGMPDAFERARELFEETVAMDSTYVEPLVHLHDIAIEHGDTAGVRRWGELLLAIDSANAVAARVHYARSLGLAGPDHHESLRLDSLPTVAVVRLLALGATRPPDDPVVSVVLERFHARPLPDEAVSLGRALEYLGMRTGRPSLRALGTPLQQDFESWRDLDRLIVAVYWLRDADSVRAGVAEVRGAMERHRASAPGGAAPGAAADRECVLGHAAVAQGDLAEVARIAELLDRERPLTREGTIDPNIRACVLYLRAAHAVYGRAPDAARMVEQLDDSIAAGVANDQFTNQVYQLATARLLEQVGLPERALAAVRRRIYLPWANYWHTEMWAEEARLADQLGRRDEAIDAYTRYLAFREDAEGVFAERAEQARARLAVLAGER